MNKISADIVFPVSSAPIKNGILIYDDNGLIHDLIDPSLSNTSFSDVNKVKGWLVPGFINTHCHLELSVWKSHMPTKTGLDKFLRTIASQKMTDRFDQDEIMSSIEAAEQEMVENGIVAVGDISNSEISFAQKSLGRLYYHSFIEVFGSDDKSAQKIMEKAKQILQNHHSLVSGKTSIVPHSPYSVSRQLLKEIASNSKNQISSIHFQENEDEIQYFKDGSGPCLDRLDFFNVPTSSFIPTKKSPIESITPFFNQNEKVLFVHNVASSISDIDFALNNLKNPFWCLCPNANLYIQGRLPNIATFEKVFDRLTLGTDSLASNNQLSILEEIKSLAFENPHITIDRYFQFATLNGANFLGIEDQYGSFEKGKQPGILRIGNTENQSLHHDSTVEIIN